MRTRRRTGSDRLLRLGIAVLTVAVSLGLTLLLLPWLYPTVTPFFFMAVIMSAGLGGWEAGLLATILSTLAVHHFFIEPRDFWQFVNVGTGVRLGLFAIAAGLTSWLDRSRRLALETARADYQALKETIEREEAARTQRRQAEEALRQSEDRFQAVAANLPRGAVFIVDRTLRYLLAAGEALQAAGMGSDDLVGKTIWEALDPSLAVSYEPYFHQALSGNPFSVEHESHDHYYISHGTPLYNDRGEVYAVLAMSYDISDRKQTEGLLRHSEELFSALVENAPFGVYLIDSTFCVRAVNRVSRAVFGNLNPLIGRDLAEIFRITWSEPFCSEAIEHFRHTLSTGEPYIASPVTEDRHTIKQTESYDWQIHRITLPDGHYGMVCYFYDLTEVKRADAIIRRTAKLDAFRVMLTDALRPLADPLEIQATTSRMLGEYLGANRVAYFEVRGADYVVECDYVNGAAPLAGGYPVDSFGSNLLSAYRTGCSVSAAHVETDPNLSPDQKSAYIAIQIAAYIGVPLVKDGEFVAGLAVHSSKPREWTADEVALVEEVADRVWTAVDRARTESALRESEARLQRAIAIETVGVIFFSTDGRITEVNEAFLRMSGYSREDVTQGLLCWNQMTPTEWTSASLKAIAEFETIGRTTPYEKEYIRKDGSRWWGLFAATRLTESEGVEFITDISDRKRVEAERQQAEAALRESEEKLSLFIKHAPAAMAMFDRKIHYLAYSQRWIEDYGLTEPIIGRSHYEVFPEIPESWRRIHQNCLAGAIEKSDDDRFVRIDGSVDWLKWEARPWFNAAGEIGGIVIFAENITDRKQAEADLRQKNAILDVVNQSAPTPIFVKDRQGKIIYANPATLEVLGKSAAEVIGYRDCDLYPNAEDAARVMDNDRRVMESAQIEVVEESPDGIRTFLGMKAPYRNEAGEIIGLIGISNDITDRIQIERDRERILQQEQAAREAAEQANRIKDEFLAVLSHELRSPLNPILGWARLLQSGNLDAAKTAQALATIERNAKLQAELIEDLLDVSRILQGKLNLNVGSINLATTIRGAIETVRLAAEAKSITVEAHLDSEVGLVAGDSTRLQQVVWNLLSNAVKFTPAGGQVEVRLEQVNHQAQIIVRDNGKGIPANFLPSVFDYFRQENGATTRQFGGLGLGLAIVRHLVELHGGTVTAASEGEGLGATFTVKLPLLKRGETKREEGGERLIDSFTFPLTELQILVIDDEPDSRDFVAFVLEQAGASVTIAATASEGFLALTQSLPDVIVSDIGMPDMDGYMLMRQVRALPPEQGGQVKAIALTAYAGDFNQQQALQAGFQRHVSKPVEPEELVRAIHALLTG